MSDESTPSPPAEAATGEALDLEPIKGRLENGYEHAGTHVVERMTNDMCSLLAEVARLRARPAEPATEVK